MYLSSQSTLVRCSYTEYENEYEYEYEYENIDEV